LLVRKKFPKTKSGKEERAASTDVLFVPVGK